ncbi:MAG TPA: DinB family protein [Candidatus Limnocylindria bacterium]|nr:DinB family protein [Candidatus Limnocylindria bacterium]
MVRARVAFHSAIQGLEASASEQATGPGEWTLREHALHLAHWDEEVGRVLESALHGIPPSWADFDAEETHRFNAAGLDGLRHLGWDDARRRLLSARMELMEALESIPDESDQVWGASHPFGAMLKDLAWNDRHHAEIIKRWRVARAV